MIDLSHLTDEEQGMIMTVLRRDIELKKAEEDRIRKLEKEKPSASELDSNLKYLSGEWFYEAKSRRHMDRIHGSEIILASMRQWKRSSSDGSVHVDRSKVPSSRGSDIVGPPKPARSLPRDPPEDPNDVQKEDVTSLARSPGRPRHNPFNRASLIVADPPETTEDTLSKQEPSETDVVSPLKNNPAGDSSQTSGGSVTSEDLSTGFRPVPKKRNFRLQQNCSSSESSGFGLDPQVDSVAIVPAPRLSLRQDSSGGSNEFSPRVKGSRQASPPARPFTLADALSRTPLSSNSSLEKDGNPASTARDRKSSLTPRGPSADAEDPRGFRTATSSQSGASTDGETPERRRGQTQSEQAKEQTVALHAETVEDSAPEYGGGGARARQEELSLTHSIVDAPVSYDLDFIDKTDETTAGKSNPKHALKLSPQSPHPAGDEEDSITKVLDWFSRSTDSSDWLNPEEPADGAEINPSEDGAEINPSEDGAEINPSEDDASPPKRDGDAAKTGAPEIKKHGFRTQTREDTSVEPIVPRTTERRGSKGRAEAQEDVNDTRDGREEGQEDESQTPKVSELKSFWEKSTPGPKVFVSKLNAPDNKVPKPVFKAEKTNKPDTHSAARKGISDPDSSDRVDEEQQKDPETKVQRFQAPEINAAPGIPLSQSNNNDTTTHLQANRSDSDTEIPRPSPKPRTLIQSRPSLENEDDSAGNPPDGIPQSPESLVNPVNASSVKTSPPDTQPSELLSETQLDADVQDFEKRRVSGNRLNKRHATRTQTRRDSREENTSEENDGQSGVAPQREDDGLTGQESTAEKIKQLKSFWENERKKPIVPNRSDKATRGAKQKKLSKRFSKSEYDVSSIGKESGSDGEDLERSYPNFTVQPMAQRTEKLSPNLGTARAQFNSLRHFWDEATSDSKGSGGVVKTGSSRRKEPAGVHLQPRVVQSDDPESHGVSTAVTKSVRAAATKSSPPSQKPPQDAETLPGLRPANESETNPPNPMGAEAGRQREPKRGFQDSSRQENATKRQTVLTKANRPSKTEKGGAGGNSLRRATSMFALSVTEENDEDPPKDDASPVPPQGRTQNRRQSADKGAVPRGSSEEAALPTPRARAFVPSDYRHYLGVSYTNSSVLLAPATQDEWSGGKPGYESDQGGPVRTSTPLCSKERNVRKGNRTSQRPLQPNYSGSETGQESTVSSTSESRPNSRNSSNRDDDDETNPVKRALRRAQARPRNLAKSLEDLTASGSPPKERRRDPAGDLRHASDVSSIPSTSSSWYSDPEHLKLISKSVPSFLDKEVEDGDSDSTYDDSFYRRRLMPGYYMTNLTSSPSVASSLSGSVVTVSSEDFGNVEVQGNIQFSINYVHKLKEFHVFVADCSDLVAGDPKRGRSDPYVKSYLIPDKAHLGKRKTSVRKKTLNPTFNEILRYQVSMDYLRTQTLILSVWHNDTFGRNSFLGEVDVDLSKWDFGHTQMNYLALKGRTMPTLPPPSGRGEIRLAIRFLPEINRSEGWAKDSANTGEIHIWVKECRNLPLIRATINPYVKCFILPDTSRRSRQKTRVLQRTVNPVFNHTMVYDGIREADLTEACVELTVWDRDKINSNLLGGLRLGSGTGGSYGALVDWMDSTSYEVSLWQRMMAAPNHWVEDVLPLRMLNSAKPTLL